MGNLPYPYEVDRCEPYFIYASKLSDTSNIKKSIIAWCEYQEYYSAEECLEEWYVNNVWK
jgi:hypothetical protein